MELYYKKQRIENINDLKGFTERWEHGKSAASIGEFVFEHDGISRITGIVDRILKYTKDRPAIKSFERAVFEHETKFDKLGKGRMHDLALFGNTNNGKSVFVGVEAKVNEEFDSRDIQSAFISGLLTRANGKSSNLPERVENLIKLNNFKPKTNSSCFTKNELNLKYQLLYSTAGTAAEKADICILLVLVFKTSLYNKENGTKNSCDYLAFMDAITSKRISEDMDLREVEVFADEKIENKKTIYAAYEYIEAKGWSN